MNREPTSTVPVLSDYLVEPESDRSVDAMTERMSSPLSQGRFRTLSPEARRGAQEELARIVSNLTGSPVVELLALGWRKYDSLTEAARRSLAEGDVEVVDLATHEITSAHEAFVDILLDQEPVATIHFEISCEFVIKALSASVRAGRLTAFHSGNCELKGSVLMDGQPITRLEGHIVLPLQLELRQGIPLIRLQQPAAGAQ